MSAQKVQWNVETEGLLLGPGHVTGMQHDSCHGNSINRIGECTLTSFTFAHTLSLGVHSSDTM